MFKLAVLLKLAIASFRFIPVTGAISDGNSTPRRVIITSENSLKTMRYSLHITSRIAPALVLLLQGACAGTGDYMRNVASEEAHGAPKLDKALVVFMLPSDLGFAAQSSVFDVRDNSPHFIDIGSSKEKFAHYAVPGKRHFLVIGQNAGFMRATPEPG